MSERKERIKKEKIARRAIMDNINKLNKLKRQIQKISVKPEAGKFRATFTYSPNEFPTADMLPTTVAVLITGSANKETLARARAETLEGIKQKSLQNSTVADFNQFTTTAGAENEVNPG